MPDARKQSRDDVLGLGPIDGDRDSAHCELSLKRRRRDRFVAAQTKAVTVAAQRLSGG